MEKIEISLDEYIIKENDRKEIIGFFSNIKNKEITECDTHGKGGFNWFPIDLVIIIIGFTASGFFQEIGKDAYLKLKSKIKELLYKQNNIEKIRYANIAFEIKGKVIYFTFEDTLIESNYDIAFEKIFSDFEDMSSKIEKLIESHPEELFGNFESMTMKFDEEENRWVIGWFNNARS
jgi:translation elongation factor EF-1beta